MKGSIIKNAWSRINPLESYSMSPTLVILYILMVIFFSIKNPLFITLKNYQVIATNAPMIGIVAIGLAVVILTGNIDLSVGSIAGLTGVIVGKILIGTQLPVISIIIIGILVGVVIGALNGFLTTIVGINSIIVTLGMWITLKGLSFMLTSKAIYFNNETFQSLGRGYVFQVIPNIILMMILIIVIMYIVLRFTKFGRNIYLVGANPTSAKVIGVNVKKIRFLAFLFSGGLAAFAGILFTSQVASGSGLFGVGWEFKALTICIVGGISLNGGRGTLVGLFLAFLILGSLTNGLTLINVPIHWRDFFEGAILLLAIIIDATRVRKKGYDF